MTLRHIKIFLAVCENGCSITKAANQMHITQPAISQAIKELEEYYNVALFDRISRRLVITRAGERFRNYAGDIAMLFDDVETEMRNWDKQGVMRVGATYTIGALFLPYYVKAFKEIYPHVDIRGFCGPVYVLEEKLINNELDVAFCESLTSNPHIAYNDYMDDHLTVFCCAEGRYSTNKKLTIEEFKKMDFVLREKNSGTRKVFDNACEKLGFTVEPVWESVSTTGVLNAVANDIGVGVLPHRLICRAIEDRLVEPMEVEGLDLSRKFYIIRHKDKKLTSAVKYFIYLCNENNFETPYM